MSPQKVPMVPRRDAKRELSFLGQQLALAEEQLEAWGQTHLWNGETVPSYEERELGSSIELLRLQRANVDNWIPSNVGQDSRSEDIQFFGTKETE